LFWKKHEKQNMEKMGNHKKGNTKLLIQLLLSPDSLPAVLVLEQ